MTKIKSFSNSWQFLGPIGLTAHHMRRWTVSFSGPLGWQGITYPIGTGSASHAREVESPLARDYPEIHSR